MANISTLIPDVQGLLKTKGWFTDALASEFSHSLALRLQERFSEKERAPQLYMSGLGAKCPRALWFSYHKPEMAQPLKPWEENKFAFGDIIETWGLTLARAAGHKVEGEQDVIWLDGVKGRRDCVLDGYIVDIKSASSRSFLKFKSRSLVQDDSFGYLDQLDSYILGCLDDPLVEVKDRGYLWAIDKQLGHMVTYEHEVREDSIRERIREHKRVVASPVPPTCKCGVHPFNKSGNIALDTKASYSPYKFCCFPKLRTFLYASGPVYLTKVVVKPKDVLEVDKYGRVVYN